MFRWFSKFLFAFFSYNLHAIVLHIRFLTFTVYNKLYPCASAPVAVTELISLFR